MRLRWVGAKRGYWTTRASERPAQAKGMSFLAEEHAHDGRQVSD
jgi:hypothetical protein